MNCDRFYSNLGTSWQRSRPDACFGRRAGVAPASFPHSLNTGLKVTHFLLARPSLNGHTPAAQSAPSHRTMSQEESRDGILRTNSYLCSAEKHDEFSMKKFTVFFVVIPVCLALVSCDSGNDSGVPNVEGIYAGLITLQGTGAVVSVKLTWNVRQSGEQVTVTGSLEGESIPAFTGTVNETGFLTIIAGGSSGSFRDAVCGLIQTVSSTAVFSEQNVSVQQEWTTSNCGNVSASGVLVRSRS
ncbi:MAG: hypothetical protein F4100_12445 [Rhodothermaceae bacterium]|nr:hypothetical protein [Rhodothermaceae bacterium]